MGPTRFLLFFVFTLTICGPTLEANSDTRRFQQMLFQASQNSSLTPFHLKLSAAETYPSNPQENKAEIEIWWAARDKWRREIKSPLFSQTAVHNGARYTESNSADYLPFWIHEPIEESTDPRIGVHHSVCFNTDGMKHFSAERRQKRGNDSAFQIRRSLVMK